MTMVWSVSSWTGCAFNTVWAQVRLKLNRSERLHAGSMPPLLNPTHPFVGANFEIWATHHPEFIRQIYEAI